MAARKTSKKTPSQKAQAKARRGASDVREAAGNVRDAAGNFGDAARNAGKSVARRTLETQKQILDFQRSAFQRGFEAMTSMRERQEDRIGSWMERSEQVPVEARELYENWLWFARTARGTFNQAVEKSFDLADQYYDRMQERVAS